MPLVVAPGSTQQLFATPSAPVLVTGLTSQAAAREVRLVKGQTDLVVPDTSVVWPPPAGGLAALGPMVFTVPADLEKGQWSLLVTAGGQQQPAVPFFIDYPSVDPVALLVVPPVLLAEQVFEITGVGFGDSPRVELLDSLQGAGAASFDDTPVVVSPHHLRARAPSISFLQKRNTYQRNMIVMDAFVAVTNSATQKRSPPVPVKIALPPPSPGTCRLEKDVLYFGTPSPGSGFPTVDTTQWLGNRRTVPSSIGGEVRVYAVDPSKDVAGQVTKLLDVVSPPDTLEGQLATVRKNGQEVGAIAWSDTGIECQLHSEYPDVGHTIVWRDDLPSAPHVYARLPQLACDNEKLLAAVKDFIEVPAPPTGLILPTGLPLSLKAVPGPRVSSLLGNIIKNDPSVLSFSIACTREDGKGKTISTPANLIGNAVSPAVLEAGVSILCQPDFASLDDFQLPLGVDAYEELDVAEWTMSVTASLTLPNCTQPHQFELLAVRFKQFPVLIPTLALLYEHSDRGGDVLIAVPGKTGLPIPAGITDQVSGTANAVVTAIGTIRHAVEAALTGIELLSKFVPIPGPNVSEVKDIFKALETKTVAIVCQDKLPDLGHVKRLNGGDFNDLLSSLVIIGVPKGRQLCLWQHYHHGAWLLADVPKENWVGGISNFLDCPAGTPNWPSAHAGGGLFHDKAINDIITSYSWL